MDTNCVCSLPAKDKTASLPPYRGTPSSNPASRGNMASNTASLPVSRGKLNTVFSPSQHMDMMVVSRSLNPPDTSHLSLPTPSRQTKHAVPETYLVLALIVSFFFNLPFGLIAVCVSISSKKAYEIGNVSGGDWRAIMSLCISLLGIFFTALLIIVIITLLLYSDGSGS